MKKVPCAAKTCGDRRVHWMRPDEPRGVYMIEVSDDFDESKRRAYCSIECACYDGAFSVRDGWLTSIFVNGAEHKIGERHKALSYAEVIELAYPGATDEMTKIAYDGGPTANSIGCVLPGESVEICAGMRFGVLRKSAFKNLDLEKKS